MVKSGTDFRNFSIIKVTRNNNKAEIETVCEGSTTTMGSKWWRFEVELKEVNQSV